MHEVVNGWDAEELAQHVADLRRTTPVIVVSSNFEGEYLFDAELIADEVGSRVEVVKLANGPTFDFQAHLPDPKLGVYAGAARIYPRAALFLVPTPQIEAAPIFFAKTSADAERRQQRLIELALQFTYRPAPPLPTPSPAIEAGESQASAGEAASLRAEVERLTASLDLADRQLAALRATLAADTERHEHELAAFRAADKDSRVPVATRQIIALNQQIAKLEGEVERLSSTPPEREAALLAENARLRRQLEDRNTAEPGKRAKAAPPLAAPEPAWWHPERFVDPDDAAREAIRRVWVDRLTAQDKQDWQLPDDYTFSREFSPSLAALTDADIPKALRACVDIVTGRVRDLRQRQARVLRSGRRGEDPPVIRADGAVLWRCNVETSTPGALRGHWAVLPSGAIELVSIAHHDDIPAA